MGEFEDIILDCEVYLFIYETGCTPIVYSSICKVVALGIVEHLGWIFLNK